MLSVLEIYCYIGIFFSLGMYILLVQSGQLGFLYDRIIKDYEEKNINPTPKQIAISGAFVLSSLIFLWLPVVAYQISQKK